MHYSEHNGQDSIVSITTVPDFLRSYNSDVCQQNVTAFNKASEGSLLHECNYNVQSSCFNLWTRKIIVESKCEDLQLVTTVTYQSLGNNFWIKHWTETDGLHEEILYVQDVISQSDTIVKFDPETFDGFKYVTRYLKVSIGPNIKVTKVNSDSILLDLINSYNPSSQNHIRVPQPPILSYSQCQALRTIKDDDNKQHEEYVISIYLKLYLAQLKCCNQSYILPETESSENKIGCLEDEFKKIALKYYPEGLLTTHIAYNIAKDHWHKKDTDINKLIELIDIERKRIND